MTVRSINRFQQEERGALNGLRPLDGIVERPGEVEGRGRSSSSSEFES
jgi:hypothetical protein